MELTPIREKADHMPQEKPEPDRIRELEDALKEAERRVAEMRTNAIKRLSLSSR